MSGKAHTLLLSLMIVAVIVFSAFGPTIAYADGGTTPEAPATEATSSSEEGSTESTEATAEATSAPEQESAEATSTPEPVVAEATEVPAEVAAEVTVEAVSEEPATDQQAAEEAAPATEEAAPTSDESVLDEVPENTTVTVLDANGEAQPLATQEAAEAIAISDPVWCPGAQAPTPDANGCTRSFPSFTELLTFLAGNPAYQGTGTIYVEQGAYQGGETNVDFNAYNLSNINTAPLIITGGWNIGNATVDPAAPSNFTNTRITIGSSTSPWGGSLTINNINMDFTNLSGTIPAVPENGLTLYSAGGITLSNVNVTNAPSAGADLTAGGGVVIENSSFNRNRTAGAIVRAGTNVTISDSSFSNPANARRQITGLDVTSNGAVTLFNVLANQNREVGTNINSGGAVTIGSSFFSDTKEMIGAGASTRFLGYGLKVNTPSTIAIDNVTANNNFLWGAMLQGGSDIAIANSIFNSNTTASPGFIDDTGLFVTGGSIVSLFNVQANDNRLFGAQINATGNVTIGGNVGSQFNNNRGIVNTGSGDTYNGHGLQITTLADIIINNTNANNNMLFGGQLTANGQVSIANSSFSNTSTGSAASVVGKGLQIVSGGNTSLTNVVLNNNQTDGATIQAGGTTWLQDNTVTNNGGNGISLQATCTNLIAGTYSGNAQYGINLGNSALNLLSPPTFSNNGAGDIFPVTPATCGFVITSAPTASGASNIFASLQVAPEQNDVSLNTFLADSRTLNDGVHGALFVGKYAYIHSDSGLQIVAYAPSSNSIAME